MIGVVVFCLIGAAVTNGDLVPNFKDCGSVNGKIISLDVTPCASFPCQFPKGKNATVVIKMSANAAVTTATTVVHGLIAGIPAPFPIPNPDACTSMKCPIASGGQVTYQNAIFVQKVFPKIRLVVKWEIQDQTGKDFICFEVPVEIVD